MKMHIRTFYAGAVTSLFVVGCRLVMPWPLKAIVHPWLSHHTSHTNTGSTWVSYLPAGLAPEFVLAGLFLLLLTGLGLADYRERLYFARFAIGFIHSLRSKAVESAVRLQKKGINERVNSGDLISRMIGDTARIKAGLKGFLVHVATNGIMFLGVTCVLLYMDWVLGLIFAIAGLVIGLITCFGASAIFYRAVKYRSKEGTLAGSISESQRGKLDADVFTSTSQVSGTQEAALTAIQGKTTWSAHFVFGAAVVSCLGAGILSVRQGRIDIDSLVVFIMYALMMRGPMVQLARQGSRTGKIFACLERVIEILQATPPEHKGSGRSVIGKLRNNINLIDVIVRGGPRKQKKMLRGLNLSIKAGQHIAVVGAVGSGKTTLLEVLNGAYKVSEGQIYWDDKQIETGCEHEMSNQVSMLPQKPLWPRQSIRHLLTSGITGSKKKKEAVDEEYLMEVLRSCQADKIVRRLPKGLDTRMSSGEYSAGEQKLLGFCRVILSNSSVLLFDDPTTSLPKKAAKKVVNAALKYAGDRTVIMTFNKLYKIKKYDRVIVLNRGCVAFDGPPIEFISTGMINNYEKKQRKIDLGMTA